MLQFTDYKTKIYTILVIDLDECYCADVYSDGEIVKRFGEHSSVPNKHKKGGQSAARFARIRENEKCAGLQNQAVRVRILATP